jgi:hypothetical protein
MGDRMKKFDKEWVKCYNDPKYFINKYCFIQHPKKGRILFNTYSHQDKCIDSFNNNEKTLILKARQMGLSSLTMAYVFWLAHFKKQKVAVFCLNSHMAKALMDKIKYMYNYLPSHMKLQLTENNVSSVTFESGAFIHIKSPRMSWTCSESMDCIVFDEACYMKNLKEIYSFIYPSLSTESDSKMIVYSSAGLTTDYFYKLYSDAKTEKNDFNVIELPWHEHPNLNKKWRKEQNKLIGDEWARRECDCNFKIEQPIPEKTLIAKLMYLFQK